MHHLYFYNIQIQTTRLYTGCTSRGNLSILLFAQIEDFKHYVEMLRYVTCLKENPTLKHMKYCEIIICLTFLLGICWMMMCFCFSYEQRSSEP